MAKQNKEKKRSKLGMALLTGALAIGMIFGMAACTPKEPTPTPTPTPTPSEQVEAVSNIRVDDTMIIWGSAKGAVGYNIEINDEVITLTPISETTFDAEGHLVNGKNEIGVQSVGKDGKTAAYTYINHSYEAEQQAEKPEKVQNIAVDVEAGKIEWTTTPGTDYSYEISINGNVIGTTNEDAISIPAEYLAEGNDYTVSIIAINGEQRSDAATKGYTIEQQQEQGDYQQQIESNVKGQLETYLREGSGYKDINNIQIQKLDVRDSETTNNDAMLVWFTANVTRGTKATNRDFIYRIPLENNYDFANAENKEKVLADAAKEFGGFELQDLAQIESVLNYESINENVVETLFTLQNCDSTLKALQGKKIEMETITTGKVPTSSVSIIAIIDGKMYNISIRNTSWDANSSFAGTIEAIKAGGNNISTSTVEFEKFSENAAIYDAAKTGAEKLNIRVGKTAVVYNNIVMPRTDYKDEGMSL